MLKKNKVKNKAMLIYKEVLIILNSSYKYPISIKMKLQVFPEL